MTMHRQIMNALKRDRRWMKFLADTEKRLRIQHESKRAQIEDVRRGAMSVERVWIKRHQVPKFTVPGHFRTIAVGPVKQSIARRDRRLARERGVVLL